MAKPGVIDRLPREVRELIGKLRDDGRTIDEILGKLGELEVDVARSTLGRHIKDLDAVAERIRESRGMAEAIVGRFGAEPENRSARVNLELMQSLMMKMLRQAESIGDAKDAMFISATLKNLIGAAKVDQDREFAIRKEMAKQAAEAAGKTAKAAGLSAEVVDKIRTSILGVT